MILPGLEFATAGAAKGMPVSILTSGLVRPDRHAHERARIRAEIAERMAVHVLDHEHVHISRAIPLEDDRLPAIFVYTLDESSEPFSDAPIRYERTLSVAVHIVVRESEHKRYEDELDRIAWAVESALLADRQLGGLVARIEAPDLQRGLEDDGDRVLAHDQLTFPVEYQTEHADLFGEDLSQIGVLYDFASPDGDIEAEDQIDL